LRVATPIAAFCRCSYGGAWALCADGPHLHIWQWRQELAER
jgi:hypothetical protein